MSLSFDLSLDRCFDWDLESDLGFWLGKLNVRDWSEAYIKVGLGFLPGFFGGHIDFKQIA